MGAQLAAPVATAVGRSAGVCRTSEQGKAKKRSGNRAVSALDRPPYFPIKRQVPGGLPLNRR